MFSPKKILVATDFSRESDVALSDAVDIAGKYRSKVELLHVLGDIQRWTFDYLIPEEEYIATRKRMLENAIKQMKRQVKKITAGKKIAVDQIVRFGNQVDEIVGEVEEKKIDLLVAAPHQKHRGWHMFFPHLADELSIRCGCETLIVRH